MNSPGETPKHIKLDERNHVEKPLLDQLADLGWQIIALMQDLLTGSGYSRAGINHEA